MDLKSKIRIIMDFPINGISFKDITTLLSDPEAFKVAVDQFSEALDGVAYDSIVGPEARGFLFGAALSYKDGKPFIAARKPGKLPCSTESISYDLEYGSNTIEIHSDSIKKGDKIVIVDDLLATGGTTKALVDLIEKMGGEVVAIVMLIELEDLRGKDLLKGYNFTSLIKYPV